MAALNHQLIHLFPGSSGLVKPVNIKKSSPYHERGNVRGERQISTHTAEQHWFMVRHVQSKIGKAVAVLCGLSSTRDLAEGQVQLSGGLRGGEDSQAGLAGSGCGHNLATVRHRTTLR